MHVPSHLLTESIRLLYLFLAIILMDYHKLNFITGISPMCVRVRARVCVFACTCVFAYSYLFKLLTSTKTIESFLLKSQTTIVLVDHRSVVSALHKSNIDYYLKAKKAVKVSLHFSTLTFFFTRP